MKRITVLPEARQSIHDRYPFMSRSTYYDFLFATYCGRGEGHSIVSVTKNHNRLLNTHRQ